MEGVQILNSFEVITKTSFSWSSFWIGALIGFGVALIAGIIFGLQEESFVAFIIMFGALSLVLSSTVGVFAGDIVGPKPVGYETHYEVCISDETNMKDFMEKYEIIDTRGDIYTVRERVYEE